MLLPNDGFFAFSEFVKNDLSEFLNDVNDNISPLDIYRKMEILDLCQLKFETIFSDIIEISYLFYE